MANRRTVRITLQSQRTQRPNGHAVGDSWIVEGKTPAGMCVSAFQSIAPFLMTPRWIFWRKPHHIESIDCTMAMVPIDPLEPSGLGRFLRGARPDRTGAYAGSPRPMSRTGRSGSKESFERIFRLPRFFRVHQLVHHHVTRRAALACRLRDM